MIVEGFPVHNCHWLSDGPTYQQAPYPVVKPATLYRECQQLDDEPGEAYDGTTVRGGAKALRARGFVGRFLWAFTLDAVVATVLEIGPVVVGVPWYADMMDPTKGGLIRARGDLLGGHALVVNGANSETGMLRLKNSWGKSWGDNGRAFISFDDFERLLKEDGEACLAQEVVT